MKYMFTPQSIIKKRRVKFMAAVLLLSIATTATHFGSLPISVQAETNTIWNADDFGNGTFNKTTSTPQLQLAPKHSNVISGDDFRQSLFNDRSQSTGMTDLYDGNLELSNLYQLDSLDVLINPEPQFYNNGLHLQNSTGYIAQYEQRLLVVDFNDLGDSTDDTVIGAHQSRGTPFSLPAIGPELTGNDNLVFLRDRNTNEVIIIDTNDTGSLADDTLTILNSSVIPEMLANTIRVLSSDGTVLYVGYDNGGLLAIETNGTATTSDDVLVGRYATNTSPPIISNRIWNLKVEDDKLFVATRSGLSVIDRQASATTSDDVLEAIYNTSSVPSISNSWINTSAVDGDFIYIVNNWETIDIIDTKGTATTSDDAVLAPNHYGGPGYYPERVEVRNDRVYVGTNAGLYIYNKNGTPDPTDDTLIRRVLQKEYINSMTALDKYLFLANDLNLSLLDTTGDRVPAAEYLGLPVQTGTGTVNTIRANANVASGQNVSIQYRLGNSTNAWRDDFDTTSSYLGDFYNWGSEFQNATITDDILQLSNPTNPWTYTNFGADYTFATTSYITARIRMNTDNPAAFTNNYLYTNEWNNQDTMFSISNEWITLVLQNFASFDKIGFDIYLNVGSWDVNDFFEIDWLQVTDGVDANWSDWSDPCPGLVCSIPNTSTSTWVQYRLNLETENLGDSPSVSGVSYWSNYHATGTYMSENEYFDRSQVLQNFSANVTNFASTSAEFSYSVDNGLTWTPIAVSESGEFDFKTRIETDQFRWRVDFSTADASVSSIVSQVNLTSESKSKSTATRVKDRKEDARNGDDKSSAPGSTQDITKEYQAILRGTIEVLEEYILILEKEND